MRRAQAWRPLLDGSLRDHALRSIEDIAHALRLLPAPRTAGRRGRDFGVEHDPCLGSGRAGVAVFFAYLAEAGMVDDAASLAERFIAEAESGLARYPMGPSLCSGFVGIAWAHDYVRGIIGGRDAIGLGKVDAAVMSLLRRSSLPAEFELLYGIAGLGVYALGRLPSRRARTTACRMIQLLAKSAERRDPGLAWFTPAEEGALVQEGGFNLGMAHGNPGVIAFLARALSAGIMESRTAKLLQHSIDWLLAQRLPARNGGGFPTMIGRDGKSSGESRVAWCYGDPGVAAALLAGARAMGRSDWRRDALRLAIHANSRPMSRTGVVNATLCHGAAGLGHLYNRLFQATGKRQLAAAARRWFGRALAFRTRTSGIAGFAPFDPQTARRAAGEKPATIDCGLLTGLSGIGLALLAASIPIEPRWDRVLLLDFASGARTCQSQD